MTLLRRALWLPVVVLLEAVLVLLTPALAVVAMLGSVVRRDRWLLRILAMVECYAVLDLVTVGRVIALRARRGAGGEWDALVRWFVDRLYRTSGRVLGLRVEVAEGSVPEPDVRAAGPLVVLARHCGPGDSFLLAWLLAVRYRRRLHVVLTARLRAEPAIDLAGDRLPLCFVRRRQRAAAVAGIAGLAAVLGPDDALLLFPEGGNFSRVRWSDAVHRLRRLGEFRKAWRARRMTNVLPPRPAGAVAALQAAPEAAVLIIAHTGLGPPGHPWWRVPVDAVLAVRTWLVPPDELPRAEPAIAAWLEERWVEVDRWIEAAGLGAAPVRVYGPQ